MRQPKDTTNIQKQYLFVSDLRKGSGSMNTKSIFPIKPPSKGKAEPASKENNSPRKMLMRGLLYESSLEKFDLEGAGFFIPELLNLF